MDRDYKILDKINDPTDMKDLSSYDLIELSKIEKKQTRFWDNILNIEENIYFDIHYFQILDTLVVLCYF